MTTTAGSTPNPDDATLAGVARPTFTGEERTPRVHELKTWPAFFTEVVFARKTFEIRKNDRDFRVGDALVLKEYDPERGRFTGEFTTRWVSYLTDYAQQPGYVVLALSRMRP